MPLKAKVNDKKIARCPAFKMSALSAFNETVTVEIYSFLFLYIAGYSLTKKIDLHKIFMYSRKKKTKKNS